MSSYYLSFSFSFGLLLGDSAALVSHQLTSKQANLLRDTIYLDGGSLWLQQYGIVYFFSHTLSILLTDSEDTMTVV